MKLLSILIFIIPSIIVKGQDSLLYAIFPIAESKVIYERVIEAPGQSKDTLYLKAKMWALSAFKSQKAALQTDDKETGILAYNTFFINNYKTPPLLGISIPQEWKYNTQVRIYIKEGKAKVVIENENLSIDNTDRTFYGGVYDLLTFKTQIEDVYKKSMAGKKYREKYWLGAIENFKVADIKYKSLMATLESMLISNKKSESDF